MIATAIRPIIHDDAKQAHTQSLGAANLTTCPHYIKDIGPLVFVTFDEHGAKFILNLTPAKARLAAACLVAGACEAEAMERKAHQKAERRTAALAKSI